MDFASMNRLRVMFLSFLLLGLPGPGGLPCLLAGEVTEASRQKEQRAPRTVIDDAAWAKAVETLSQEVGSAAVRNGAFLIPKESASIRSSAAMTIRSTDGWRSFDSAYLEDIREVLVKVDGVRSCIALLAWRTRDHAWYLTAKEGCRLSEERAREIMQVVAYLRSVTVPVDSVWEKGLRTRPFYMDSPRLEMSAWTIGEAAETPTDDGQKVGDSTEGQKFLDNLRTSCAMRYLWGLRSDGSLTLTTSPDNLIQIFREMALAVAFRPERQRSWADVEHAIVIVETLADGRMLPVLDTLLKRWKEVESSQNTPDYEMESDPSARIDAHKWVISAMSGKNPEKQAALLAKIAFPGGKYTARKGQAELILLTQWPDVWRDAALECFSTLGKDERLRTVALYCNVFPDDVRLAELAAKDPDPELHMAGLKELYRITRERKYLAEMSVPLGGDTKAWSTWADMLEYSDDRRELASILCEFLGKHDPSRAGEGGTGDGRKPRASKTDDVGTLVRALQEAPRATSADPWHSKASTIVRALCAYDDPRVKDTLLKLIVSEKSDGVLNEALFAVAEKGDSSCLDVLRMYAKSPGSSHFGALTRLTLEARLSDEPFDCLLTLSETDWALISNGYAVSIWVLPVLAQKYTVEKLEECLATDKYARVWPVVYGTLLCKRAKLMTDDGV